MELACQRPNLLLIDAGQYEVASDGQVLYFALPGYNQYTQSPAPKNLADQHLPAGSILGGVDEGHPELTDFFFRSDAADVFLKQLAKISWITNVVVSGISCRVLAWETVRGTKVAIAVDTNRMVMLKVRAEVPAAATQPGAAPMPASAPPTTVMLTYDLLQVQLNSRLEAATFAYKPPAGLRRVSEIGADPEPSALSQPERSSGPEGAHLLNHPLPEISGRDLADKPLTADDLRRKTVLLFCWSLSGGEYCLLSIPIVQEVADHFKSRTDLVVLGLTGDTDQTEVIKQLLERKKTTFRNLLDPGRQIQTELQLGGVPTFIVAGPDGLVKWAKLGAPPTLKEDLIREIEKAMAKSPK